MVFGFGKKRIDLHPPFAGDVVAMADVPDPVFAQGMVGDGFAVVPDPGAEVLEVCAPASGRLLKVFGSLHAFALVTEEGLEVLVHIGLDTVELKGEGFEALAATGDTVTAGQPVVRVDAAALTAGGIRLVTPVALTKKKQVGSVKVTTGRATPASVAATVTLA